MENITFDKIASIINSNKTFSIYIHVHTDIDAIGSALSLKNVLENMGKTAHIFVDSTFPENTKMFRDIGLINNQKNSSYDVCICLDCCDEARLGRLRYKYRKNVKTTLQIDHHLNNERFCKNNYVDESASSTCELMYCLYKNIDVELDLETVKLLLSGILTDTGSLKFSNVTPKTLLIASELLKQSGLTMDQLTMPLFNSLSVQAFGLRKLAYEKVRLFDENKIALISITKEDFKSLNARFDETKGLTDIAMQIESVKAVALISESDVEEQTFYVSIRTKDNYNAQKIALEFGGGGHLKASGCKLVDKLDVAQQKILQAIRKEVK